MKSSPIPAEDDSLLTSLRSAVQEFVAMDDVPDGLVLRNAYVIGSRGAGTEDENSELDILLSLGCSDLIPESELSELCDELQTFILWECTGSILTASGLELSPSKANLDVLVYPHGVAKFELGEYMGHGGGTMAYSLIDGEYFR